MGLLSGPDNLLSRMGFGTRVRAIETARSGNTALRTMIFGSDRPPDPDALDGAQIAVHRFPGVFHRRLAEMAPYPDPTDAATG